MNRSMKHSRRTGFTLIELLVVVAIIALLISILLPSLAAAREQAKRAACSANLKGIAFACLTYAEDAKGILPTYDQKTAGQSVTYVGTMRTTPERTLGSTDPQSNARCYFRMVLSKATQPKVYLCPSAMGTVDHKFDRADAMRVGTENPVFDFNGQKGRQEEMDHFSYSFANNVVDVSGAPQQGVRTKNTHDPRKAILADRNPLCNNVIAGSNVDEGSYQHAAWANEDLSLERPTLPNGTPNPKYDPQIITKANSRNHKQQGQNVGYLDGHAKWSRTPRAGADDDYIWTPSKLSTNPTGYVDVLPSDLAGTTLGTKKSPSTAMTDSFLVP